MFSLRKWVKDIAIDAIIENRKTIDADNAAAEPFNVDGELDDGVTLLYAYEKRLLPVAEWKAKAVKWQEEYGTEGRWAYGYLFDVKQSRLACAMRRAILTANVEIAKAEQKAAMDALKQAQKAVRGSEPHP